MVGITANPASGKDIRRLIASGTVLTNQQKINTVIRMLKAMDALGVANVQIMPDPSHLGQRVIIPVGIRHSVRYQPNGPRVVDIKRCLHFAAKQGALRH